MEKTVEQEKKELVNKVNQEETLKLHLTDTLRETTRLAGTFKVNAMMYEDEKLVNLLNEGAEALSKFNKGLAEFLSK